MKISPRKLIASAATFVCAEILVLICSIGAPGGIVKEFLMINLVFLGIGALVGALLGLMALWDWAK